MNKKEITRRIREYEYYHNAFHKICGNWVAVKNVKVRKDRVFADVILGNSNDNTIERYNECEYTIPFLRKLKV